MNTDFPLTRDLVLIGGGHAHALVLRKWGMTPLPGARLTLIDPNPKAPYTGMLPGHIAGHYPRAALDIDLGRLARFAGARLIVGHAAGIDRAARRVQVPGRPDVAYDVLSIDIGITSAPAEIDGFQTHGIAAKPLGPFADRWADFVGDVTAGAVPPDCAVLGGGVAGVELALAMHHRLAQVHAAPRVHVIDTGKALSGVAPSTARLLRAQMKMAGIALTEGAGIAQISRDSVVLADGSPIAAALCVSAAGARPWPWLAQTGLNLTDGFISVGADLRSASDPVIFAAGDCAHLTHAPRPKAGVYAVRAAPILHHNLRAALTEQTQIRRFKPQKRYLKLISLGGKDAIADRGALGLHLPGLWRWKDRIDQRFMQKFRDLPTMPAPALPREMAQGAAQELSDHPMICGGCGAKVGPEALNTALAGARTGQRDDVLIRPGDDAGALRIGGQVQVISTDHLRAFTADPWLMTRITAIHALGDVWAMGAAPQAALVNLVLPRMSGPLQARTLAEIMAAAQDVMAGAGAEIIGGHTTQGAELTIGFTVTGLMAKGRAPIGVDGARPGDHLILTGALGTGVILAADMGGHADGDVVRNALDHMATSPQTAAHGLMSAHAMTDVTGFGLAGHLLAICRASGCGAALDMGALPLLEGAQSLLEAGHRSSLHGANRAWSAPDMIDLDDTPRSEILFDPQTAGGFLAAMAPEDAAKALAQLEVACVPAVQIGEMLDAPPRVTLRQNLLHAR
ncbi:selenide, water dikinase SelD [Roseovarius sp. M141]|uniref:selenide, water dikinase SelD n=1 Tax=Roseovarius sp. M141 TaxID=2583806 RepID=UPI0020CE7B68|nr:selenide, water dikinase SelD [Roseovarius sp. M141]MCQ0091563.1 selenide, water dikinase SelD [Roseovarius sp. M141]